MAASIPPTTAPTPGVGATQKAGARKRKPLREGILTETGEFVRFSWEAIKALRGTPRYFSEVMRLNAVMTRRTSVLLLVMCFFIGVNVGNFGFFFLRSIGASDFVGLVGGLFAPRQSGPQMFGYVFSGGIGCAIAAELGAAKISDEVAAYESEGINPMEMLVGTRILAVLLFIPMATVIVLAGSLLGTYTSVVLVLKGNSSETFLSTYFSVQSVGNYFSLAVTLAVLALVCTLVACFYGLRTRGGPDAVGGAVARSLGVNLVLLHVIVTVFALLFYGGGLKVPIGD